jgi:beta-glucosidase
MVAAYVRGAQSVNVGTTLKHFIGNETENHRRANNSIIDERTLHEIYLPPFRAGIDAGAWAVMTAYNLVNGEWAGESKYVVTDLLRQQLGFKGLVMTDWASVWYGDRFADSGNDLEEPTGFALQYDRDKVFGGTNIDRMVVDILKTGIASGIYELEAKHEFTTPEWRDKYPMHEKFSEHVNEEGIVLLANNGLLPLTTAFNGKILVCGNAAKQEQISGGGSGHVVGFHLSSYLTAIEKFFSTNQVVYLENPTDEEIQSAGLVLVFAGRPDETEGSNHEFQLADDALIARCTKLNPKTVVNLICGGGAEMDWADQAAAILMDSYGGQTAPTALLNILTGKVNPSGKLPFTIERNFEDSCAANDAELTNSGALLVDPMDLAARSVKTAQRNFISRGKSGSDYTYDLKYNEGIFVGYRWYDEKNIQPRFPFGFGLSYTKFAYSGMDLETNGNHQVIVNFTVANIGKMAGDEVAEVYVGLPQTDIPQPKRELKGFARVHLNPGEKQTVTVQLGPDAFSYWDPKAQAWTIPAGTFKVEAGTSSRDIRLTKDLDF